MSNIDRSPSTVKETPCLVCETPTTAYQVMREQTGLNQHLCASCVEHASESALRTAVAELDVLTRSQVGAVLSSFDSLAQSSVPGEGSEQSGGTRARRSTPAFSDTFAIRTVDFGALLEYGRLRPASNGNLINNGSFVGAQMGTSRPLEQIEMVAAVIIVYFTDGEERFGCPVLCFGDTHETLGTAVERFFTDYEQRFGPLGEYIA
jgi:hypothetical protein